MARILVIDDDSGVRGVLKVMLERSGHTVSAAANGAEGLRLLGEQPTDLVIVDVEMPGMNGFDVCSMIKTDPKTRTLPVVIMTGRPISGVPERARAVGAIDLLHKPFERDRLIQKVAQYLGTATA
jgi:CheY-like chemotaxis protein